MEKQIIYNMTNHHGQKFLRCFDNYNIIGVERTDDNVLRKEFTVVYNNGKEVCTAILPDVDSNNNGCCLFGDLKHFAMCYAEQKSGVQLRLQSNGNLMWPVWYTEKEDFMRWLGFYKEMMQKYA